MRTTKQPARAAWFMPPAAFVWTLLQTAASPRTLTYAIVFALVAIPIGRWVDRECYKNARP